MEEIRYFMEESIFTVDSEASVKIAADMMRENSISSLLMDQGGKYCGFLSDTDLTRKLVAQNLDPEKTKVSDIASKTVISMEADCTMADAYERMKEKNIRHLTITNNGEVAGILSIKDFANYYHNKHSQDDDEKGNIQYYMQSSIYNIESYETVLAAAQIMNDKKIGALLVTENGKAKGVLSESIITSDIVAHGNNAADSKVASVFNPQLITIDQSQSMSKAYQLMRKNNVRQLFVIRGKKIAGILTIKDFANYYNFKFCKQIDDEDRIKLYMQENLETVPETMSVLNAAEIMKDKGIGSLLVKNSEEISGIVTEEDFARRVIGNHLDPEQTPLSKVMKSLTSIDQNQTMDTALTLMHKNDIRYVTVTNEGNVIGIISLKDLTIYYKHKYILASDMDDPTNQ